MRLFARGSTTTLLALFLLFAEASCASADLTVSEEDSVSFEPHWKPWWPRFHWVEGVVAIGAEALAITIYVTEPSREARWLDPAPLDEEIREAWRLHSYEDRDAVVLASDVLFVTLLAWPVVVDALLLAGLVRGDTDTMVQMLLIDAEVLAVAHLIHWMTTRLVGRVRPIHRECVPLDSCADRGVGPVASFVSGHSMLAYAAAGLICTHHLFHPWMTGSYEGAALMCGSSLMMATITSAMRVMVDLHWASDVGIGAVLGSTVGWVLPLALHYAWPRPRSDASSRESSPFGIAIRPGAGPEPTGITVFGTF